MLQQYKYVCSGCTLEEPCILKNFSSDMPQCCPSGLHNNYTSWSVVVYMFERKNFKCIDEDKGIFEYTTIDDDNNIHHYIFTVRENDEIVDFISVFNGHMDGSPDLIDLSVSCSIFCEHIKYEIRSNDESSI